MVLAKQFRRVKQTPLWLLLILSLAGYLLLLNWFPLVPYFNKVPTWDVRAFTPSLSGGLRYGLLLLFLFGMYGLSYRRLQQMSTLPSVGIVLLTVVLFSLPLLQTYPINATDIYRYFIQGRISSLYGESPFALPPNAFPNDPFLPLAGEWAGDTSPYGPLWELIARVITGAVQQDLYPGLLSFKLLGLMGHIVIAWLIWQLLSNASPQRRLTYTALWAWNPALLLTFVVDAHNDFMMIIWLLSGLLVMRRGYPTMGFLLMILAPLFKPIALLPLPLFFIACWRAQSGNQARRRFLFLTLLGGITAVTLAFLPFGSPFDLVDRLASEASDFAGFSVTTLIILAVRLFGRPFSFQPLVYMVRALFAILALWLSWRTWHGRSAIRGAADIFYGYLLQALNYRLWYSTWLLPWLLLDETENGAGNGAENGVGNGVGNGRLPYRLRAGLWFLLTTQLSVVIYGHLHAYVFNRVNFITHLIGVPFVFGLPFLLAKIVKGSR